LKGTYPLTLVKLHRILLEILKHPETKFALRHMTKYTAAANWDHILPPTNLLIRIDANNSENPSDYILEVAHELTHIAFCGMVIGWLDAQLEEAVILGVEKLLTEYITSSPKRKSRWTAAIQQKLSEMAAPEPEKTLMEQTSRPPSLNRTAKE
jgi:hypothetical protein